MMIEEFHPVDPDTKEKLPVFDRITVKDFYKKLSDIFLIYKATLACKKFKK